MATLFASVDYRKVIVIASTVLILSLFIFLPDLFFFLKNGVYNYAFTGVIIVTVLLLVPIVLFFYNLKIYYYLLAAIAAFTPIALLPVLLINSVPNVEMLGLVLETNYHEVTELLDWGQILLLLLFIILFFVGFVGLSKKLPRRLPFKTAALVSALSLGAFLCVPFLRTTILKYYPIIINRTFRAYYPFRISKAFTVLSKELKNTENYNKAVANFSFSATKNINDTARNIHVLIIGETARYDHWSINGYHRETSPNLAKQSNLISFSNVASGGPMTHLSIPLLITRADAASYDLHQRERSIFQAYKEVGYKTFWVSNQSRYGLAGHIGMHYADADTTIFNGWGDNNGNFTGNYDSALLPIIQNAIAQNKDRDLFLLVHTIGSHWRYLLRYPESFTRFKPVSDRNRSLIGHRPDSITINEYDNSILYSDYIINQIIELVKASQADASVTYVSDHGENLNDDDRHLYFHSYSPTKYTVHVPFFMWLSDRYVQKFPEKVGMLQAHKELPVSSASNTFYTLLDLAHIQIKNRDDKRSIASPLFTGDPQKVLGENGAVLSFKNIK
jgi:glucan phosphoethanolaminetransferase (alkaline phosphatase superfamily)